MKANVGGVDKILRIVFGGVLIVVAIVMYFIWDSLFLWALIGGIVGIVLLGTGLMNFCLAYLPFGLSTHKSDTTQ